MRYGVADFDGGIMDVWLGVVVLALANAIYTQKMKRCVAPLLAA